MEFKDKFIFNNITHKNKLGCMSNFYDCDFIYDMLWYFVSEESFWQRSKLYDSFFEKEKVFDDSFFAMWLLQKLKLNEIKVFDSVAKMNECINNFNYLKDDILYLYVNSNKQTIFSSFFEKLRNSIAHGTFNLVNKSFLFIGQISSKKQGKADINFLLNISNIGLLKSLINELSKGVCSFVEAFFENNDILVNSGKYYINDKELILLDNFEFKSHSNITHKKQLITFLDEAGVNNSIIVIKDNKTIKYDDEWFTNNNILVINIKNIYSFLKFNIQIENADTK